MNVLIWFKRDLRISDHPALSLAAAQGRLLPLYVVEPEAWRQPDRSARQWDFVAESLEDLRRDLAGLGAPLVVRVGEAVEVLAKLCRLYKIGRIISLHQSEGTWAEARDARVADWARQAGIEWQVVEPNLTAPETTTFSLVEGVEPGLIPTSRALRLAEDRCAHRQAGGRSTGLLLMEGFFATRGAGYRAGSASPLLSERASSRLSPYLSQGCLSAKDVSDAMLARRAERPPAPWGASLASLAVRLADRAELLDTPEPSLQPARPYDAARLAAWSSGETGLPFLDACIRYLMATGWLNFRLRGMVLAAAAGQLSLDPQAAGLVLARRFTDYCPALHWPLVARFSGVDGIAPRIDPVREGKLLDADGTFTRRWVPELAPVPDEFLHDPWKWHGAKTLLGRRYPEAVVDPASAVRAPRAQMAANRGAPRRLRIASGQLGFEF